jgi:lysophospholipase L1-like esterase
MSVAIHAGDHIWFYGDSITQGVGHNEGDYPWPSPPGGLVAQMQTLVASASIVTPGVATGPVSTCTGARGSVVPVAGAIFPSTFGQGGATFTDISNYLPAQLASVPASLPSPVFVIEGGVNDGGNTSEATTGINSIISQLRATWPACRLIFLSVFCQGSEVWQTGPVWPPATQNVAGPINTVIQTLVTAAGGAYVDNWDALLTWEAANNPGKASSGFATVDGTHPKIVGMTAVMAPTFLAAVSVGP